MKKSISKGVIIATLLAVTWPGVASADLMSDFSQKEQDLSNTAVTVTSLADELRVLDATTEIKTAFMARLGEQAEQARRELASVNQDLLKMQLDRRTAQQQLSRYVRTEYVAQPPNEFMLIASPRSLIQNLAAQAYIADFEQYANQIVSKLRDVEGQIADRQQESRDKIAQMDKLEDQVKTESAELDAVRTKKAHLLASTQGREDLFRAQYEAAKAQLVAQGKFARSARQRIVSRVWDDSGFYFNQLDSRWIDAKLGYSSSSKIGDFGCGVASLAMVFKYYGIQTNPAALNDQLKHSGVFVDDLLDWRYVAAASGGHLALANSPYPVGPGNVDWGFIDRQLASGNPVIVYIDRPGEQSHYVVLLQKQGSDYVMHDPVEGPYLKFRRYYRPDAVYQYITFRRR